MNPTRIGTASRVAGPRAAARALGAALALGASLVVSVRGDAYRPEPTPGGIDSRPVITSLTVGTSNVTLRFRGLQAPYEVQATPFLAASNLWSPAASTLLKAPAETGSVTISNLAGPTGFFRMKMSGPSFVGASKCYACHDEKISSWLATGHATALDALKDASGNISASNLQNGAVFRSTGYGQPGGFVDPAATPQLANVGCENCHGAAGSHSFISSRNYHLVSTVAAEVCGGCHTTAQGPAYNEWTNSLHARVTPDVAAGSSGIATPGATGFGRQMSCGPCHSGATRLAMVGNVEATEAGYTNSLALPTPEDGAHFGITCAVCHDPHSPGAGPHQLRNPAFSTNFYTFFTGSDTRSNVGTDVFGVSTTNLYYVNTVFATQYVASVQICGQCHNARGALWTGTSRPPHHSPQYNILVGSVQPGYLNGTANLIGPHGLNTNGCVPCHMHQETVASPTEATPNYTGHEFKAALNGCAVARCHDSTNVAGNLMTAIQSETSARIQGVVDLLNSWATTKAPTITNAFTPYGQYAWEFTSPGQLSNPTNNPAIVGPSTALQGRIPDLIKKARFNLYLIEHDASRGVHNIDYTRFLLKDAGTNVQNALQ
jgi:hypothetical protein